jgi:hypothetical protein
MEHVMSVLKTRLPLSTDEQTAIQRAAKRTWEYIGYDVLSALAEQGESDSIPRRDVIELVLDADYMVTANRDLDRDLYNRFKELPYDVQNEVVKGAFPFTRYGM